jgi:tripartite-type tricarboxylate transporter receptor subunit TctC
LPACGLRFFPVIRFVAVVFAPAAMAKDSSFIGVKVTHVPYRGSAQAMQDLIAGRIDYICALAAAAIPQIESNTMKAITVMTRDRSPIVPTLASTHEQGLADFDSYPWFGFFLPKGVSPSVVQSLHVAAAAAIDTPSVQERLKAIGVMAVGRSSDYLTRFLASEIEKWAVIIKSNGISLEQYRSVAILASPEAPSGAYGRGYARAQSF